MNAQSIGTNPSINRRTRNVAHLWSDKRVIRWFRHTFNKNQYSRLRTIYFTLCEIDSDFTEHPISSFSKTLMKYAGVSSRITTNTIFFLEQLQLISVKQNNKGNKGFGQTVLKLYEWDGQDQYYLDNKEYFDDILNGKITRRTRKQQMSLTTNVDDYKNTKVSIIKNTKVSKIYSKEYKLSKKARILKPKRKNKKSTISVNLKKRSLQKIIKKSDSQETSSSSDSFIKDLLPKPKYKYTTLDFQLYNELIECGATRHNETKQAYFNSMNAIHEILNPAKKNPYYASRDVSDDYKAKIWDFDEIIDTFKYYISIADKVHYKAISSFLYQQGRGTKTWSPLVKFNIDMHRDNGDTLEGNEKSLMKSLQKIGVTELDASAVKRVINLLDLYTEGYGVNPQLNHLYFGNPMHLFVAHVKNNMRNVNFKPGYMQGEKFMKQFISDATKDRSLVKGINGYASI